jgi:hypothetical protein
MIRTQIQLSEEQARTLKEMAAKYETSMADLIRQAVDEWIRSAGAVDREERKQRAIAVAGRFHSDYTDLSIAHDRHLAEAFEE